MKPTLEKCGRCYEPVREGWGYDGSEWHPLKVAETEVEDVDNFICQECMSELQARAEAQADEQ